MVEKLMAELEENNLDTLLDVSVNTPFMASYFSGNTLEEIIRNDSTLNFFINGDINWFNDHQVKLRFKALEIALGYYIEKMALHYKNL